MGQKCRYCFLISRNDENIKNLFISRNDEHIENLFQSWDRVFQNEDALRNHERTKYCEKNQTTTRVLATARSIICSSFPNTTFKLAEVDGVPSNTQDEDIRAQSARSQRNTGHAKVLKRHL